MSGKFLFFCTEWIWMGRGAVEQIVPEAKQFGVNKALIITDPGLDEAGVPKIVKNVLEKNGIKVEIFSSVKPEPPLELVDECAEVAKKEKVDLLLGLGGGSSMDTAKAASIVMTNGGSIRDYFGSDLATKAGFPVFLIPTTAGTGSEVTRNAIFKDVKANAKKAVVSRYILPRAAIIDPELALMTPPRVTANTGMDALSHSLEAFFSKNANALSDMYALEAIKLVAENLPKAVENGSNIEAREKMSLAALCGGVALVAGAGAIAATSYPVEGHFNVPHGLGNAIMMPYVVRYNAQASIPKARMAAGRFGINTQGISDAALADCLADRIVELMQKIAITSRLGDFGVKVGDIPMLAEEAFQNKRLLNCNPRELTVESIKEIYKVAI
jgi:alcohol dehydrogenase class IV